jgi:flagellar FliL protein
MSEEKPAAPPPEAAAAAPSGGGSKIVLILTLVNVLVTLGMFGFMFVSFKKEKSTAVVTDIALQEGHGEGGGKKEGGDGGHGGAATAGGAAHGKSKFGKMVTLDQFAVNLTTPGSSTPKFVRVNISLEVPSDDAESEVTQKMPQVRNTVIDLFNSKRASDLATAEGRDYLKEEIKNAINSFMVSGKVKGVFFTNFAVTS